MKRKILSITMMVALSGCTTIEKTNHTAPSPNVMPNYLDSEISELAKELIDEKRQLALIRKAKLEAERPQSTESPTIPSATLFTGLDKKRNFECYCDLKVIMQGLSVQLGWDLNNVYELGHKPANGLPVKVAIKNQPLALILEQVDVAVGNVVDVRIDPHFESILIEYKSLTPTQPVR